MTKNILYQLLIGKWQKKFFPGIKRKNFWTRFNLRDFTPAEWEDLCDGCGLCCLNKFDTEEEGKIEFTKVACRLLDCSTCQCKHYEARKKIVPDCTDITLTLLEEKPFWLPSSCAYRRLFENKPLSDWHHLISGNRESVHEQGISGRGWMISETEIPEDKIQDHIIEGR